MRNKETYYGEVADTPEVIGRQLHIPCAIVQDPRRPYVITMPLSDAEKFIRVVARVLQKAKDDRKSEVRAKPGFFDDETD